MTALNFDQQGHLVPYDLIETNWEQFVDTFGWNDHRHRLIDSLYLLLNELDNFS